jgi:hypothetical protein
LIWKLQKVYDENPDCGQLSGFGVQKSNKRLSAFILLDGALCLWVFYNKLSISQTIYLP